MRPNRSAASRGRSAARRHAGSAQRPIAQDELDALYDDAVRDTIAPLRGDGLARRHRRRAAQAELRDLPDRRPRDARAGRRRRSPSRTGTRGSSRVLTAGPFRYATYAGALPGGRADVRACPAETGRDLRLRAEPALPAGRASPAIRGRPSSRISCARPRPTSAAASRPGRTRPDRFHRGPAGRQARPVEGRFSTTSSSSTTVCSSASRRERAPRIGVHTCPGGDQDSTHSADVDYAELLPALFRLEVGSFFVQLASETDRVRVLDDPRKHATGEPADLRRRHRPDRPAHRDGRGGARTACSRPRVHRSRRPARHDRRLRLLPVRRRRSTSRETAFAKIRARVTAPARLRRARDLERLDPLLPLAIPAVRKDQENTEPVAPSSTTPTSFPPGLAASAYDPQEGLQPRSAPCSVLHQPRTHRRRRQGSRGSKSAQRAERSAPLLSGSSHVRERPGVERDPLSLQAESALGPSASSISPRR